MELDKLDSTARRQLMKLACIAAWTDLEVVERERDFIVALGVRLGLSEAALDEVRGWLRSGPPELDPGSLPLEHKRAFLGVYSEILISDGRIDPMESRSFELLRELLS
jgi:hypothetical protein